MRRLLHRIGLDSEDIDRATHAGAVGVADEQTIAGDAEPPPVAGPVEITPTPGARCRILRRQYGDDPMQVFEVAEQVEVLFEQREPLRASASDANGSIFPSALTRTDGIWANGVSNVLGWQPAGSFDRSTHGAALCRTGQRAGEDHQDSYHHSN